MPAGVPLPDPGNLFEGNGLAQNAYERILPLEGQYTLWIRVLGYMLIRAPMLAGRNHVAARIISCTTDQDIIQLGRFYRDYFINYFRFKSKLSGAPAIHPWHPEFAAIQQIIYDSLRGAPADYSQAKKKALIRDNHRCMLSGVIDEVSIESLPWLMDEAMNAPEIVVASTECSHILPQYINRGLTIGSRRHISAIIWTILSLFGAAPHHELNGSGIHDMRNVMTLEARVHTWFDGLQIWLEPVGGTENQYFVRRRTPYIGRGLPPLVTFSTTSTDLPLPDPRFLALHAACARVIELSGARFS